jgi:Sulfatase-modifying factor enzyme 1
MQRVRLMQRVGALFIVLAAVIFAGLIGWRYHDYLREQVRQFVTIRPYVQTQVRPYALVTEREQTLKPKDTFRECAKNCPEMVIVPAGDFMMGSPANEKGRDDKEGPQHKVVFAKPFAVSKFEVTFDEWDACVEYGDCAGIKDSPCGPGRSPVINVSWAETQRYVAWLSRATGSRMGVCRARRNNDGLLLGRRDRQGQRQLRKLRQSMGQQADGSGRLVRLQCFWRARHARQCLGMG